MEPLLEVHHLQKKFGRHTAVQDITFSLPQGACMGLLGPNGAGKTTTMEIIEDIIQPSSGTILYKGTERNARFHEEIGIQFQHTSLLNYVTVQETLNIFSALFTAPERLDRLIALCDLTPLLPWRTERLSGGQAQRLLIALALINRPHLLFLDEPSTGLDPQARRNLWQIINEIRQQGKTIILTTHSMEEAEFLCDTVAIVDRGTIIAMGAPAELIRKHCATSAITFAPPAERETAFPAQLAALKIPWSHRDGTYRIETADLEKTLHLLIANGIDLQGMSISSPNLEEVFLHLTGRELRD